MSENVTVQIFGKAIPFTKENQKATAQTLAARVTDGDVDPIEAYTTIKAMAECLNAFLKDKNVMEATVSACEKHGRFGASYNGANICVAEVGVKYDFSVCHDPEWDELAKQKAEIEAQLKAREAFLRTVPGQQTIVSEETGQVVTIYPPAKSSSTSVKVTFAK
ncbi:MAG: hypothetical protein K2H86_06970 [Muribaculaceae bacterium]|nr:hypothetical protein [Muribaculaceae bacterium]